MYQELAKKYLIKARSTSGKTGQYFANLCQVCLAKEGIKAEDIGTSDQELASLKNSIPAKRQTQQVSTPSKQDMQIETCKKYLTMCQKAEGSNRQYYANLCLSTLKQYGLSAEEIGSTDADLQKLASKGFIESAINYLQQARKAQGVKRKCYADLCQEYLARAKAKPVDIGSTEQELQQMYAQ